jgi:hypothetical protein
MENPVPLDTRVDAGYRQAKVLKAFFPRWDSTTPTHSIFVDGVMNYSTRKHPPRKRFIKRKSLADRWVIGLRDMIRPSPK